MQKVQNVGSLLQAYSLQKMLKDMGNDVSFIDIQRIEEDARMLETGECYGHECDGGTGLLSKLRKLDRYAWNRIRIKRLSNQQLKLYEEFRKDVLDIKEEDNEKTYDCCVIGSDEVFNCNVASKWGFTSQLFGNVKQAKKVITYAASCGSTTYERTPQPVRDRISETFEGVSALSVRDANTYDFASKLTTKVVHQHMDPVVVADFEKELQECGCVSDLPERYCVLYSYYNRFHKEEEIEYIKEFCKKHQLEIVTIGAPQMWIKKHLVATPFQVLDVFKKADFVITDTFHGTIFSAKYAKKLAVMTRKSNENKLLDLIKKLGLQKHLINSLDQLSEVYQLDIDKSKVEEVVLAERAKTLQYLKENV